MLFAHNLPRVCFSTTFHPFGQCYRGVYTQVIKSTVRILSWHLHTIYRLYVFQQLLPFAKNVAAVLIRILPCYFHISYQGCVFEQLFPVWSMEPRCSVRKLSGM